MFKNVVLVVIGCLFLSCSSCASAQPAIDRPLDSNMKAGKIFTIRVVPGSKNLDVFVVGSKSATLDWSELNVVATIKVGKKKWFIIPEKLDDRFVITEPTDIPTNAKTQLRLLLDHKEDDEVLEVDLAPRR